MVVFKDYPEFRPNLTPLQVMKMGSFGGTYWRPIHSTVTKKNHKNQHNKYNWNVDEDILSLPWNEYDKKINKYGVKVGSTLEYWEDHDWIRAQDPYGWFQWYCEFYKGRRSNDDERQIDRWLKLAGPNGRFRRSLINKIDKAHAKYNDESVSPAIRQTLQHWSYKLSKADYEK
jgi:hypothetical protein